MSEWNKTFGCIKEALEKWGKVQIHCTDPLSFTVELTGDKQKLKQIKEILDRGNSKATPSLEYATRLDEIQEVLDSE